MEAVGIQQSLLLGDRFYKSRLSVGVKFRFHLTLLAKSDNKYKNLLKVHTNKVSLIYLCLYLFISTISIIHFGCKVTLEGGQAHIFLFMCVFILFPQIFQVFSWVPRRKLARCDVWRRPAHLHAYSCFINLQYLPLHTWIYIECYCYILFQFSLCCTFREFFL